MLLPNVPRKLIRHALRAWQDIISVGAQYGVFVICNEIKTVPVLTLDDQKILDQLIDDLPGYFVGVFDAGGDYQAFLSDVALTASQLAKRDNDDSEG